MTIFELTEATGIKYAIRCGCGFLTPARATLAAAGAEMDAHQAKALPRPSDRRECPRKPELSYEQLLQGNELTPTVNSDSPDSEKSGKSDN
jgi:hypothetical protein